MNGPREPGKPLVEVRNLKKWFRVNSPMFSLHTRRLRAVDDVTFSIGTAENFGLVGESGCGKTTVGKIILRLLDPTGGSVFFEGCDLNRLTHREMKKVRRDMQVVFQDPYASLDPKMSIGSIVGEPLETHRLASGQKLKSQVQELLELVGLNPEHYKRYPHEFSGGQRQRICIARALALKPKFVVCDEPLSALDVSIRAQLINLLADLQKEFGLSYLFISHDLSVVRHICDRVAVMYLGKLFEIAQGEALFSRPLHPYTQALLSAVPIARPGGKGERIILKGDIPSPIDPPPGCRFHTRCVAAMNRCKVEIPELLDVGGSHVVACWLHRKSNL